MSSGLKGWTEIPVVLALVLAAIPLLYVVLGSAQTGLGHFAALVWRPYVGMLLVHTLELAVGVTTLSVCVGVGAAWLVERTDLARRGLDPALEEVAASLGVSR